MQYIKMIRNNIFYTSAILIVADILLICIGLTYIQAHGLYSIQESFIASTNFILEACFPGLLFALFFSFSQKIRSAFLRIFFRSVICLVFILFNLLAALAFSLPSDAYPDFVELTIVYTFTLVYIITGIVLLIAPILQVIKQKLLRTK